ncbi:hypothetical protein [Natronorubrum texcoconense]|uniref:Uncharacterized protein n=1 Tax=Natronorubrum texcoconense TaxID=1095776 RepID=A0A1G9F0F4_9EURY|nr:hypothetical protein [Natronorubrum texcoconense]SDK81870.1 hypothetical protein SAMN04515672_4047 [Natronorubrum texcoconense]
MTDTTDEPDEIEIEIERAERGGSDGDDRDTVDAPPRTERSGSAGTSPPAGSRANRAESSPERRLEDELGRIDISTTSEGYVEGHVTGLESIDETTVRLDASLPHGETVSFTLDKPIPWSDEFLLARIVEDVGYDASSIGHLVDERVYLARVDLEESTDESEGDWWSWPSSARAGGWDILVSSLSGGRYRLERDVEPEWRLVDPRERRSNEDAGDRLTHDTTMLGALLLVLAPLVVAVGVAYGLTGGLLLSATVVGVALLGVVLSLLGGAALVRGDD